ncbi:NUDIX hydrolase [Clostridium botulinum]|uniref:ADP-ribose pyrophosphatase n=1 Tax=Clostridium botulinum TaxID=1491 RepID=A0A9Q1ZAQ2_CLOBO|nr:NUDIX hydrolase [Clostridium botulinum]AEB75953.1 hydrolase, NUDIX family [Clostridium botulinum BKT015925]KEH97261.1 ADP-ribose pyrophosphatase [Clostridium botulinum D str. 16868]KEH97500.1 ADP-ribose pyrophosphatase [Clostridium botulinum C/D str. Sp77]KLU75723.1 ADP-ribose pyrophosphatase [Clostridium botulinum V891]KOA75152.1 ADP-ribose pyrophosphatase [Clostridium botulinum]
MNFTEKTINEVNEYNGKIIKLDVRTVELPNGKTAKREIVKHPGGVAILAFKDKETILLVEQFRNPLGNTILEIPAGKLEQNEEIEICGRRELEEETGYKANKFTYLGKIVTSPGFCNECIYIYKAQELYQGIIGGDEDEFINIHEIKIEKLKEMIKNGDVIDGKTIAALTFI